MEQVSDANVWRVPQKRLRHCRYEQITPRHRARILYVGHALHSVRAQSIARPGHDVARSRELEIRNPRRCSGVEHGVGLVAGRKQEGEATRRANIPPLLTVPVAVADGVIQVEVEGVTILHEVVPFAHGVQQTIARTDRALGIMIAAVEVDPDGTFGVWSRNRETIPE